LYDRTEIRKFFADFWKNPDNVRRFIEQRENSHIGKVDKFGRRYNTQEEVDKQSQGAGFPVFRFRCE
jgi:hypothetical protein